MKEQISKLEDNLNTVEKLYFRINKRQSDLQNDYTNFANSIQGLSALETNITNSLYQFAETSKAYSKAMKDMTEVEEVQFLNEIHELLAYCHAAKVKFDWVHLIIAGLTLFFLWKRTYWKQETKNNLISRNYLYIYIKQYSYVIVHNIQAENTMIEEWQLGAYTSQIMWQTSWMKCEVSTWREHDEKSWVS